TRWPEPTGSVPPGHLRAVEAADLELHRLGARVAGGERDSQPPRVAQQSPQRLLVVDEHGDRFVRVRAVGGHAPRRLVVDRHLDPAAAVAGPGEVARLEHQIAAAAPFGVVAEDQLHRPGPAAVDVHRLLRVDGRRHLLAALYRDGLVGPQRLEATGLVLGRAPGARFLVPGPQARGRLGVGPA